MTMTERLARAQMEVCPGPGAPDQRARAIELTHRVCARRFPLEPLRRRFFDCGRCVLPSNLELSRLLGVHVRQVQRWIAEGGLTERYADEVACRIRLHPANIWPEWWDAAEGAPT